MRRRAFITLLGGAAAAWPLAAKAQQADRMRRIGVLAGSAQENDPAAQTDLAVFRQTLQQLGWIEGRNVRYEYRSWSSGSVDLARRNAAELVALDPDVILVQGAVNVEALQRATRTIPIVFASLTDPVGAGFVESLARPGGNTTGLTSFEYGLSTKWVELLKEVAPRVTRAGVVREQGGSVGIGLWAAMQGAAPSQGMELRPIGAREASDVERGIAAFARGPNAGLIVTVTPVASIERVAFVGRTMKDLDVLGVTVERTIALQFVAPIARCETGGVGRSRALAADSCPAVVDGIFVARIVGVHAVCEA